MIEIRDWVEGAAGQPLRTAEDAMAWLAEHDREGNWSITVGSEGFGLCTGDQWVFGSDDRAMVEACVIGIAIATILPSC